MASDEGTEAKRPEKKRVQKKSMADAFKSILSKNVPTIMAEDSAPLAGVPTAVADVVLSKYKKRGRELDASVAKEEEKSRKRQLRE